MRLRANSDSRKRQRRLVRSNRISRRSATQRADTPSVDGIRITNTRTSNWLIIILLTLSFENGELAQPPLCGFYYKCDKTQTRKMGVALHEYSWTAKRQAPRVLCHDPPIPKPTCLMYLRHHHLSHVFVMDNRETHTREHPLEPTQTVYVISMLSLWNVYPSLSRPNSNRARADFPRHASFESDPENLLSETNVYPSLARPNSNRDLFLLSLFTISFYYLFLLSLFTISFYYLFLLSFCSMFGDCSKFTVLLKSIQ